MKQEIVTRTGEKLEVNRGGNLLTNKIIFDRPDLFEKCPPEIQEALKLYHTAINLFSHADYEGGRELMEKASKTLTPKV